MTITKRLQQAAVPAVVIGTGAAAVLCLGGCATSDPLAGMSAQQIVSQARTSLQSAPGFRIAGSMPSGNTGGGQAPAFGMQMTYAKGTGCTGTIGMGGGSELQITAVKGTLYAHPNARFWSANFGSDASEMSAGTEGKWLSDSTSSAAVSSVAQVCQQQDFENQFGSGGKKPTRAAREITYEGQKALVITDPGSGDTMTVADTSPAKVLAITSQVQGKPYTARVTYLDHAPKVTAPPPSQTLSPAQSKALAQF